MIHIICFIYVLLGLDGAAMYICLFVFIFRFYLFFIIFMINRELILCNFTIL